MDKKFSNPCIRCGSERVVLRTWEEKVENSIIVNIETVCPNPECQKMVNKDNKKQYDKYMAMKLRSKNRLLSRKAAIKKSYRKTMAGR